MDVQVNNANAAGLPRNMNHMKVAYTVSERQGRSYWTRVGVGFVNRDGSINIRLDAIPVSGGLQLRDWSPREADSELPGATSRPASKPSFGEDEKRTADIPF